MSFKISLAGDLGSGKSTVSRLIIARTGAEYYGTGVIARSIAAKYGMDIAAFNIYMETHPELDKEIDDGLRALSDVDRTMIIDSRMAWHFVRNTFRVYLTTDPTSSVARIFGDGRSTESFSTPDEAAERIRARKASEKKRYFELYGVDCKNLHNYDLVVDTTYASPEQVAERILRSLSEWEHEKSPRGCYLCPCRLRYPDEAPDAELVTRFSAMAERGEALPPVDVFAENENFYIQNGNAVALACALAEMPFVACRLTDGSTDGKHYVKMENSLL